MENLCTDPLPVLNHSIGGTCLRGDSEKAGGGADILAQEEDHVKQGLEKVLRCRACDLAITSPKKRCSRDGKHQHTFFNPAGVVYEIGCFSDAPGCLLSGSPSREFTWFKGYSWQVAYCNKCLEHLGWYFSGTESGFFGLRINCLREG